MKDLGQDPISLDLSAIFVPPAIPLGSSLSARRPGPALSLHTTDGPSAQTRTARLSPGPDHGPDQARHTIPPHPHNRPDGATLVCSPLPRKRRHDAAPPTWAPAQLELILTQVSPSQHGPRPPWARTRTADVPHARSRFHKHANALFKHTYAKWARESTRE